MVRQAHHKLAQGIVFAAVARHRPPAIAIQDNRNCLRINPPASRSIFEKSVMGTLEKLVGQAPP